MLKYSPESKGKLERKVKDIDSKAKDRTKHMANVVKDNKTVGNLFRHLRLGGTAEGMREVNSHLQQARKEVKREYGHKKKSLEGIVKKAGKLESELKERGKYSKLNYKELTKASSSIKETHAAKRGLDRGRQAAQKDIYTMDSLRDSIHRVMQRTSQCFQKMSYEIANTLISVNSDVNSKYWFQAHRVNQVAMQKERNKNKSVSSEVEFVSQENLDDKLCLKAEKNAKKAAAAAAKETRLEAGQHLQDGKRIEVADETPKKPDPNYGRHPLGIPEQNNIYNQKDTYLDK